MASSLTLTGYPQKLKTTVTAALEQEGLFDKLQLRAGSRSREDSNETQITTTTAGTASTVTADRARPSDMQLTAITADRKQGLQITATAIMARQAMQDLRDTATHRLSKASSEDQLQTEHDLQTQVTQLQ